MSRPRTASALLAATILGAAAAATWSAGRRGFFAFDQSIPFDAGWRVLSGQVPFRDFVLPVGPVLPWLQAVGFALFGADFRGYLLTACLLDVAAAGLAMLLVARLVPDHRSAWAAAGLLTALWFQPPSGTPWFEPVAYLAALPGLAAWAVDLARPESRPSRRAATGIAAGAALGASFLAKQNVAVFLAPGVALLLAVELRFDGARAAAGRALALAAGASLVAGAFGAWLAVAAEPALFVRHVAEIPGTLAPVRALWDPFTLMVVPWTGAGPLAPRLVLMGLGIAAAAVLLRGILAPSPGRRRGAVSAALVVGLLACQNLLALVTRNQPELSYGLLGVLAALGLAVAWEAARSISPGIAGSRRWRMGAAVVAAAAVAVLAARGVGVAFGRTVHEGVAGVASHRPLGVDRLEPLLWAEPTRIREATVTAADVETLVDTLAARPGGLFVFPDWTVLYGLLGRPSPQPLLWFHPDLTYPGRGDPALDRWIVRALHEARVETVVVEEVSWLGTRARLADFPALADFLERCFAPERRIGPFEIRTLRPGCGERPGRTPTPGFSRASVAKRRRCP